MRRMKLLAAAGLMALALGASPAWADGTQANTTVSNTATLSYQSGGVAQNNVTSNTATFLVDRKINLTVAESGGAATLVQGAGVLNQVTTFTVQNTSNQTLDFALLATNQVTGTAAPFNGATDSYDVTNIRYYVETGTTPGFDATDTLVTYLDEVGIDQTRTVYVVADVPANLPNGAVASVVLTATAREGGTAGGTVGAAITATTGADTAGVDTVFADGAGATDAARDGAFSARDQYTIQAAVLNFIKVATVIQDPVNGTTNPKAIPGATVEYCLIVNNTGQTQATAVNVTDNISGQPITYVANTGLVGGLAVPNGATFACDQASGNTGSSTGASYTGTTFTGAIGVVPANSQRTARFRVTIN